MLKKNIKMFYLLVVALLFTSSIGYAESFNFENIDYDTNCNLALSNGNIVNYNYNQTSNKNVPSSNYSKYNVVVNDYNYNWGNVVTIPVRPSKPVVPSTPNVPSKPSVPTKPTVPTTPTVPTKPTTPTLPNTSLSAMEQEVVRLTNIEREKAGLKPFTASTELSKVARLKSEDMGRNNYFSHTSPTYGSPFDMMKQFGIKYSTAGENIAKGYLSAASVVNGWMNSSGHRANILNPSFNTIGVGAYTTSNNTTYWTQQFTN